MDKTGFFVSSVFQGESTESNRFLIYDDKATTGKKSSSRPLQRKFARVDDAEVAVPPEAN
jgi:hypothetical protein